MKLIPIPVAMAVLYHNQHFLMQLRDDKEGILYPGQWGLFGGHLELEEAPEAGLIREVKEEINYLVTEPTLFRCYNDTKVTRHIFFAPLTVSVDSLELNEGWDLDLVPLNSIQLGRHYSHQAKEERYLGAIHRRILLDFAVFAHNNLLSF
ncbi:ADP-ribose pyrophosphatase [Hyella patelloides LEGE 07179]|uniref:ADP-ribose pyrophosphatase n=1 Tax=Hyella patelloides LEGE 07179 TaxID=945734 RepID=A0A563VXH7_9CYAN|nr:NUDIX domain-containing protein [Hyella patelloides]VEP16120.1 ADP-ribose pyrophosphatase [Hyella patelloides LEGE 07179]